LNLNRWHVAEIKPPTVLRPCQSQAQYYILIALQFSKYTLERKDRGDFA